MKGGVGWERGLNKLRPDNDTNYQILKHKTIKKRLKLMEIVNFYKEAEYIRKVKDRNLKKERGVRDNKNIL